MTGGQKKRKVAQSRVSWIVLLDLAIREQPVQLALCLNTHPAGARQLPPGPESHTTELAVCVIHYSRTVGSALLTQWFLEGSPGPCRSLSPVEGSLQGRTIFLTILTH